VLLLPLLLVALVGGPRAHAADDVPAPGQVYVRTPGSMADTVRYLEAEATRIGATQVMVAFDAATFDPPPGLTEFTLEYPFFADLPGWLDAFEMWGARATCMLRGTSSLAPRSVDLTRPGAVAEMTALVRSSWWEGERPAQLPDAATWMTDILARTEDVVRAADATPVRMLVLLASGVLPERGGVAEADKGYESEWRRKLAPAGTSFDEGRVAAALSRFACRLYVVAPEARFGQIAPFLEAPELPWMSRPHLPLGELRWDPGPTTGPGRGGRSLRDLLDEGFRDTIPDPEDRRRAVEEALRNMPQGGGRVPGIVSPFAGGRRFRPTTPVWFQRIASALPCNNHAPSGYGHWPYAQVAARSDGRYVFYPFPPSEWLDRCPAQMALVNTLAPELVRRSAYLAARRGDPALAVIARAAALVFDETPWADTMPHHRAARSWTSFTSTSPLRLERHAFPDRLPFDDALWGTEDGIERIGVRIQEDVLPRYDQAIELLESAMKRMRPGEGGVHPRSHAHLLLTRYGLVMSAFHLEAYSIYAREIDRFIPDSMRGHVDRVLVTYVPTIRLSDCLEAYDGRELDAASESRYPRWIPDDAPGYQGNLLVIDEGNPDYRARRSLPLVLRHLDRRLRGRALRMIDAARDVMATYGETGWGWTTYYGDAYTFLFKPVEVQRGHRPTRGGGRAPDRPTTPRGGGTGGGGSSGGGPASGG
jgi:hypothetical protein